MADLKPRENETKQNGIPRQIRAAVVVQSDATSLRAIMKITAIFSSGVGRFGTLWPKKSSLLITDLKATGFGTSPSEKKFDWLTEETWKAYVGINRQ